MPRRAILSLAVVLLAFLGAWFLWRSRGGDERVTAATLSARLADAPFDAVARLELAEKEYQGGMKFLKEEPPWPTGTGETEAIEAWREELDLWAEYGEDVDALRATARTSPRAFARVYPVRRAALGRRLLRRAVLHFRQAEALGSSLTPNQVYRVGNAYFTLGEGTYRFAEKYMRRSTQGGLSSAHAFTFLGNIAYLSGDTPAALGWYRKALELSPEEPVIAYNLGLAYTENGNPKDALPFLQGAVEALGNREDLSEEEIALLAQAQLAHGVAAFRTGAHEEAVRAFTDLLETNDKSLEAHYWLGITYAESGRIAKAKEHLQRVLRADPGYRAGDARARLRLLEDGVRP